MSKWVHVTEKLPKTFQNVLVCDLNGNVTLAARIEGLVFINRVSNQWMYTVTLWQPLPEPPEGWR